MTGERFFGAEYVEAVAVGHVPDFRHRKTSHRTRLTGLAHPSHKKSRARIERVREALGHQHVTDRRTELPQYVQSAIGTTEGNPVPLAKAIVSDSRPLATEPSTENARRTISE